MKKTDRISDTKDGIKFFVLNIFPPLLLLPLAAIPFDITTSIFWFPAFVSAAVSLFHSCSWCYRYFSSSGKPFSKKKFVRPLTTLTIFVIAVLSVELSKIPAKEYVMREAERIQAECRRNGECPEMEDAFPSGLAMKGYLAKYRILYFMYGKDFVLAVRYNIDEGFAVSGGVNKKISTYHRK